MEAGATFVLPVSSFIIKFAIVQLNLSLTICNLMITYRSILRLELGTHISYIIIYYLTIILLRLLANDHLEFCMSALKYSTRVNDSR